MTVMQTVVDDKVYDISWEHPWREMDFRGERKTIKVTNCVIALNLGKDPETEKTKYRILGHGAAKWPIEATDPNADNPGSRTRSLLKGEQLGRDKARRISLARALASIRLDKKIRTAIWENYFRTFNSVRKPFPPPTPLESTIVAQIPAEVTSPYIPSTSGYVMHGGHGVISKVVSHVRFMPSLSNLVH